MITEITRMIRTIASTIKAPIPWMTTEITRTIRTVASTIKALTPQMMSEIPGMTTETMRTIRALSLQMMSKIPCMTMRMISQSPRIKNASTMVWRKWKGGVVGRKINKIKVFYLFLIWSQLWLIHLLGIFFFTLIDGFLAYDFVSYMHWLFKIFFAYFWYNFICYVWTFWVEKMCLFFAYFLVWFIY